MSRERWGTFSVIDHLQPKAFVTDVLLYDRLVIPFPPDETERKRWYKNNWQPDELDEKFELLGDLAVRVPWDEYKQETFKTVFSTNSAIGFDAENHLSYDRQNPYEVTKILLMKKFLPELPVNVAKVWAMAAYTSYNGYKNDMDVFAKNNAQKIRHLYTVISQKFLVPDAADKSDNDLLKEAIQLVVRDDFKEKREALFKWQENIVAENISDTKAIEELEEYLRQYNEVVDKASSSKKWKFGFLVMNLLGAVTGLAAGHPEALPLVGAGLTGLASVAQYIKFDGKVDIEKNEIYAAAMIHDVQKDFNWE